MVLRHDPSLRRWPGKALQASALLRLALKPHEAPPERRRAMSQNRALLILNSVGQSFLFPLRLQPDLDL
jgi:hypothetical protein